MRPGLSCVLAAVLIALLTPELRGPEWFKMAVLAAAYSKIAYLAPPYLYN